MSSWKVLVLESGAEEIANRNLHAGIGFAVPVHSQHQFAQMKWDGRIDGEPDMPDRSRTLDVRERHRGPGFHRNPIVVAAGEVRAGGTAGNRVAQVGQPV